MVADYATALDGPALLVPVGSASLPPARRGAHGGGEVCAACWRVAHDGSAAELLVATADGAIVSVPAPSFEAVDHARAAVDAAGDEHGGLAAGAVAGIEGCPWPVDTSSGVVVHVDASGGAPGAAVSLSAGPGDAGPVFAALPSRTCPMVVTTPWAVGAAPSPGALEGEEGEGKEDEGAEAGLPAGRRFPVARDLTLRGDEGDDGDGTEGGGGGFPRQAAPLPEAGILALDVAPTGSGSAVAVVTAAGSVSVSFVSDEGGGRLVAAGGTSTPSVGRAAVTAPYRGTCVALAPCGTRTVVGCADGSVMVVTQAGTPLDVHDPAPQLPSGEEAGVGARLQLVAEAVGPAASVGSRCGTAPGRGQPSSGSHSNVGGAGEPAVWQLGVGVWAASGLSDEAADAARGGWASEMRVRAGGTGDLTDGDGDEEGGGGDDPFGGDGDPGGRAEGAAAGRGAGPGDAAPATCLDWARWVEEDRAEAAAEPFRDALRERLGELAHRVAELVEGNAAAPELERLRREEFAVDEEGDAAAEAETEAMVESVRARVRAEIAAAERQAAEIKAECWDGVERPMEAVHALGGGGVSRVWSMTVRRLSEADSRLLDKLALLRRMEQAETRDSAEGAVDEMEDGDVVWAGLASDLPADADWMVNAGVIPAALDPVAQREALEAAKRRREEAAKEEAAAAGAAVGGAGAAGGKGGGGGVGGGGGDDDEGSDGEGGGKEEEAAGASVGRTDGWSGDRVVRLLYHPLACRTSAQRRMQVRLLEQLSREVARAFNVRFDALRQAKREERERISDRSGRMRRILGVLGREEELFEASHFEDERPEGLLEATREEVGFEPWQDPEEERRRAEEARAREEAASSNKDDAPTRALDDMMRGTLEEKDDVQRTEDALRMARQPWMDAAEAALLARAGVIEAEAGPVLEAVLDEAMGRPAADIDPELFAKGQAALDGDDGVDALPEEQQAPWRAYRAMLRRLIELREARRVRLEAELAALRAEVAGIVRDFDARLEAARGQYREFRAAILTQEAYAHRLAVAVAGSDANIEREQYVLERLAAFTMAADREAAAVPPAEQALAAAQRRLEEARARDAAMEHGVRDALRERSELGVDAEMLRRLSDVVARARHDVSDELEAVRAAMAGRDARPGAVAMAREAVGEMVTTGGAPARAVGGVASTRHAAATHEPAAGAPRTAPPSVSALVAAAEARAAADPSHDMVPDDVVVGETVEVEVWEQALALRRAKAVSEVGLARLQMDVDRAASALGSARAALARSQGKVAALEDERNALLRANALTANDVDVMVRLRQGQDEVAGLAAIPDYTEAVLVPTRVLERENRRICRAGRRVARRLESVRDARKDLRYREWMREYSEGMLQDRSEWLRDVSLLRVTKELQAFVGGADLAQKQKELTVKTEAQGRYLKKAHRRLQGKQDRALHRVEGQVRAMRTENARLLAQLTELEQAVAVRTGIVEARERGAGGGVGPRARADKRMTALVTRSKLVASAKSQAEELDALRAELTRLRKRTFPMFTAGTA